MSKRLPVARYLDHAVLKPEMSRAEAREAILAGVAHKVRTVCVRPCDIAMAVELCAGTDTEVSCVLAFPHGCTTPAMKACEAREAIAAGTREIDMVANYGFIRSGLRDEMLADVRAVTDVARPAGILVKVILETCTLSEDQIRLATEVAVEAGADYVKTSTGFHSGGASEQAVAAMLAAGKGRIKVKASGGIRTLEDAERFLDMGCERLGVGYGSTPALCAGEQEQADGTY
jgi:deoxyribose-phosphate aldolase